MTRTRTRLSIQLRVLTASVLTCLLLLPLFGCGGSREELQDLFRVCVFSDFMPLSNPDADQISGFQGFYLDFATLLADRMGKRMEAYFPMEAFYKRPVRAGLLAGHCDAQFGLPRDEGDWYIRGSVLLSAPFTSIGYSVVLPRSQPVETLVDLKGMTVGVQAGSPPQFALSEIEGLEMHTFLFPEQALEALEDATIDAAFVWGPVAGYLNKFVYENSYRVVPSGFSWPVAIGVRADNTLLKERLDFLIDDLENEIRQLRARYGLPYGDVIPVHELRQETLTESRDALPSFEGDPEDVSRGRGLFNATLGCAHCHGPSLEAGEDKVDLRLMHRRHGDLALGVFQETVLDGRPGTEMRGWRETLAGQEVWLGQLQAYVFSLQRE